MLPRLLASITVVMLSTGVSRAQITDITKGVPDGGDIPSIGEWSPYYQRSRTPEDAGRDTEIEQNYRSAIAKIPNKKPSNDPWKGIRMAPTAAVDRHRLQ